MTDLERALQLKEKLITLVDLSVDENLIGDNYYKQERKYLIDYYPEKVPICIKQCRNLNDFTNFLKSVDTGTGSWHSRRMFIYNEFDSFLDFLEFGESVQNTKLQSEDVLELENSLSIILEKELFEHIQKYLKTEDYYHAVKESYMFVREKIKQITGTEITGTEDIYKSFREENHIKLFGKIAESDNEKNYFEGIEFLHLAIQKFRNEKSHQTSHPIDKNLAFQYIILANLAFKLIKTTN